MIILSTRQQKLLSYLYNAEDYIKGSQLAKICSVSDRTIRNDIEVIKKLIDKEIIISSKKEGYLFNKNYNIDDLHIKEFMLPRERLIYIIKTLIISSEGRNIYELAEEIFISEPTLLGDLTFIKKHINSRGMNLSIEKKGENIILQGRFLEKVNLLVFMVKNNFPYTSIEKYNKFFNDIDIPEIKKIIFKFLNQENLFSRYLSIRMLCIHVFIIIEMSYNGENLGEDEKVFIEPRTKINNINCLVKSLEEICKVKISSEFGVILEACFQDSIMMEEIETNIRFSDITLDPLYSKMTNILMEIKDVFVLEFAIESQLIKNLITHIKIALFRAEKNIQIINPLKKDLRQKYPYLFDIGLYISRRLFDFTNIKLNQDEVSYIVSHVGCFYKDPNANNNINNKKLKVLLLALEGEVVTNYIKERVEILNKSESIELYTISSQHDYRIAQYHSLYVDLIIATMPVEIWGKSPDLVIFPRINMVDEYSINKLVTNALENTKKKKFDEIFNKFFNKKLFLKSDGVLEKNEEINQMCKTLIDYRYVSKGFLESVLEREKLMSTCIGTGIALPHSTSQTAKKTGVLVNILDNEIMWGENKVKIIFMFAIKQEDIVLLNSFYSFIAKITIDESKIEMIRDCDTFEEFKEKLFYIYIND